MHISNRHHFLARPYPLSSFIKTAEEHPQLAFDTGRTIEEWEAAVSVMEKYTGPRAWPADKDFVNWIINRLPDLIMYNDPNKFAERLLLSCCRHPRPNEIRFWAMKEAVRIALEGYENLGDRKFALAKVSSVLMQSIFNLDYWRIENIQNFCRQLIGEIDPGQGDHPYSDGSWFLAKRGIKLIHEAGDFTLLPDLTSIRDALQSDNPVRHMDEFALAENLAFLNTGIKRLQGMKSSVSYEKFIKDANARLQDKVGPVRMGVIHTSSKIKVGDSLFVGVQIHPPANLKFNRSGLEWMMITCRAEGFEDVKVIEGNDLEPRDKGCQSWNRLNEQLRCVFELTGPCRGEQLVFLTVGIPPAANNETHDFTTAFVVTVE
ncbi:MAG: hypothetical protein A2751_02450 [Candidatus Doudnabacteria bacterium RIFCSPHIGHO2_01_FULL_46_14]|uniref:Uncharacterized protein n=1 Tax=Candidatus Doudnabacteria bacterium RIFCSPHIGHO2_01_FULL_46_14 TaxID=1817824 RepID=A0A1F5NK49_9BACT|nr:MAG: hypothetical protein A2751_02450 [Candidatus Doudnabacteria bacterium RIFCSPHIGHO2_01_FULL_46_14]